MLKWLCSELGSSASFLTVLYYRVPVTDRHHRRPSRRDLEQTRCRPISHLLAQQVPRGHRQECRAFQGHECVSPTGARGDTSPPDPCLTSWRVQFGVVRDARPKKRTTKPTAHSCLKIFQSSTSSLLNLFPLCDLFVPSFFLVCDLSCVVCRPLLLYTSYRRYSHSLNPCVFTGSRPNGVTDLLCQRSGAAEHRHHVWHCSTSRACLCGDAHQLFRRHIVWAQFPSVPSLLVLKSSQKIQCLPGSSTGVTPTPSTWGQPFSTVKCALPASISGKAYSVTPVVYVTRTVSSTLFTVSPYTCDPIPATSVNKGNFRFACKSLLGKDLGLGYQTLSWRLPAAASVSIEAQTFFALRPRSTIKYVVNTALATTTLIPTTAVFVYPSTTITRTLASTSTVKVTTGTTTCHVTVTVTAAPVSSPRRRRAGGANLPRDAKLLPVSDSAAADADAGHDPAHDNGNDNSTGTGMDLKERAAATPTIGRPDFVYPPYGVTTVYVKSSATTSITMFQVSWFYTSGPPVTTTVSYLAYTASTVTVTVTRAA